MDNNSMPAMPGMGGLYAGTNPLLWLITLAFLGRRDLLGQAGNGGDVGTGLGLGSLIQSQNTQNAELACRLGDQVGGATSTLLEAANGNQARLTDALHNAQEMLTKCFCDTNQNISQSTFALNAAMTQQGERSREAIAGVAAALAQCCCQTQLGLKDVQAAICKCCCDLGHKLDMGFAAVTNGQCMQTSAITAEIRNDGDKTRALIQATTLQETRDRLAEAKLDASQCKQNATFAAALQGQSELILRHMHPWWPMGNGGGPPGPPAK